MADNRESFLVDLSYAENVIFNNLWKQKLNNNFCDVVIKVFNHTENAHGNLLAATCVYFNNFFSEVDLSLFAPSSPQILQIHSDSWDEEKSLQYEEGIASLIKFLYRGQLVISTRNVGIVSELAGVLELKHIVDFCKSFQSNEHHPERCICKGNNLYESMNITQTVDAATDTNDGFDSPMKSVVDLGVIPPRRKRGRPRKGEEVNPKPGTGRDDELDKDFKVNDNRLDCDQIGTRRSSRRHKPTLKSNTEEEINIKEEPVLRYKNDTTEISIEEIDDPSLRKIKYQCEECSFVCEKRYDMDEHIRLHIIDTNKCPFCFADFSSVDEVKQHLTENHKGPDRFQCRECSTCFPTIRRLQLHLPKHSSNRPYACEICNSAFKWKHQLKVHYKVHSGDKPHLCDVCGYATAYPAQLRAHCLVHSGKTLRCPVQDCTFQTIKKQNLSGHMKTHSKEKPYICDSCGQSFSLQKNLKRHMYVHTDERPYFCSVKDCDFSCTRADKLKEHEYRMHQIGKAPNPRPKISDLVAKDYASKTSLKDLDSVVAPLACVSAGNVIHVYDRENVHENEVVYRVQEEAMNSASSSKEEHDVLFANL